MAKTTLMTCDVHADGITPATHSVSMGVGRRSWSVDLCAQHEKELQEALARFAPMKTSSKKSADPQEIAARERRDAIRAWGAENGVDVPQRGRISQDIQDQFDAATSGGSKRKRK